MDSQPDINIVISWENNREKVEGLKGRKKNNKIKDIPKDDNDQLF